MRISNEILEQLKPFEFTDFVASSPANVYRRSDSEARRKEVAVKAEEEVIVPSVVTYNESEYKEAVEQAYKRGYAEGEQYGRNQGEALGRGERMALDAQLNGALEMVAQQLLAHVDQVQQHRAALMRDALALAASVARKMAEHVLNSQQMSHLEAVLEKALPMLAGEEKVVLYTAQALQDEMQQRLSVLLQQRGISIPLEYKAEEGLPPHAVRVVWQHGGLEHNPQAVWQQVEALLGMVGGENKEKLDKAPIKG